MSKRARSCLYRPRRKEGEEATLGPVLHISIDYETLEDLFHLPRKEAAKQVGLCPTTFKKACRRFGMDEWPFQKGQSRVPRREVKAQDDGVIASINTQLQQPAAITSQDAALLSHESLIELNAACTSPAWWEMSNMHASFSSETTTVRASSRGFSECEVSSCSSATPRHDHTSAPFDPDVTPEPHHVSFASHAEVFSAPTQHVSFATHAQCFPAPEFDPGSFFVGASVSDAVMDYLEGPSLAESFEFMFLPAEQDDDFGPRASFD